jgi:malonyl-CoA/methylmalonyl-CoA synthetase
VNAERRLAIVGDDAALSHAELSACAQAFARRLSDGRPSLEGARVAIWLPPGAAFAVALQAVWHAGGVAVPLALSHPLPEIDYVLQDAAAAMLVVPPDKVTEWRPVGDRHGTRVEPAGTLAATGDLAIAGADRAGHGPAPAHGLGDLILYTSGTTGRAKGVVLPARALAAQVRSLRAAWGWTASDRALLVLPLHHVHGLVNLLCCPLAAGAACEVLPAFDAVRTWLRLSSGEVTVFSAVPTIYHRLLGAWEAASEAERRAWSAGCRSVRLMMSGSAALPVPLFERWRAVTGHTLLERYGMTEIGMALSNPLEGERRPGSVGAPLPGVDVRLVDEGGHAVPAGEPGELEVRGPTLFSEYWRRPDATRDAFRDGWFRTGDVAVIEAGLFRLLGRKSVDILKTGGFKVSAVEVESALREHPAVADCAVVGCPDEEWGERILAAVELRPAEPSTAEALALWARGRLAPYKVPRRVLIVPALPRNAMGKVIKRDVLRLFE